MSGKTLLFADDSGTMRTIVEKTFHAESIRVFSVPSGEAAIAKAREVSPDIIIVDAGMTGISGYDVCQNVRQDPSLGGVPVVLMSGISSPYDEARGRSVGATEYIKKPFDTGKLIERVNELLAAAPAAKAVPAPVASVASVAPRMPVSPARPAPGVGLSGMVASTAPRPPMPPMSRAPESAVPSKATMEFVRPSHPVVEPEPIELQEDLSSESDFKVGTLAELAQMSPDGGAVKQEHREDAIEIDAPKYGRSAPLPEARPAAVQPVAPRIAPQTAEAPKMSAVRSEVRELATKAVAAVPGLTPQQAEAILKLTEDVVEKVVWEVVPDLAETMIREKLDRLLKE